MADGKIVINTELNYDQAAKELDRLNRKIKSLEDKLADQKNVRLPLVEQSRDLAAALDAAKAKLAEMQSGDSFYTNDQIKEQEALVASMQKDWDKVQDRVEKYDEKIRITEESLRRAKEEAGGLTGAMTTSTKATDGMAKATDKAGTAMEKFVNRVKGLAKRVFIFSLITAALRKLRGWMVKVLKTNSEAAASLAKLRGALLTLAQPLVEVIIPVLAKLITLLARIVTVAAQLMAKVFGKSIGQTSAAAAALNDETEAMEGLGDAAKDTAKNMSGLDEINTWDDGSSGGAGGATGGISPDFDLSDMAIAEDKLSGLDQLVGIVVNSVKDRILSFFDWLDEKTGGRLKPIIEFIKQYVTDRFGIILNTISGIIDATKLILTGIVKFVSGVLTGDFDKAWSGIKDIFAGIWQYIVAVLTGALDLIINSIEAKLQLIKNAFFGIVDWIRNLFLSILDWVDKKTNGKLKPIIDYIRSLVVGVFNSIKAAVGNAIDAIKQILVNIIGLVKNVFTGNWKGAWDNIKNIFDGIWKSIIAVPKAALDLIISSIKAEIQLIQNILLGVINWIRNLLLSALDWIDQKTGGKLKTIIDYVRNLVISVFKNIIDFVKNVFAGNWKAAWDNIKNIFKTIWNGIISILEGAVNFIIRGINWLIDRLNKIHFDVPNWVPGVGGKSIGINIQHVADVKIPRLAQGAVIPPNHEFAAILGDQKRGNNLEMPEALLRKIMREEGGGRGGVYQFIAQLNRRTIFEEMIEEGRAQQARTGRNPFAVL